MEPASNSTEPLPPEYDEAISDTAEVAKVDTEADICSGVCPPTLDLDTLVQLSSSRSCQEAISLVSDSIIELLKLQQQDTIPFQDNGAPYLSVSRPQQFGDLLYIPAGPEKLFVMSDLEGDFGAVEALFRQNQLLPLMAQGRAQCIFLGDSIDRDGKQASQILEFLLDLKFRRGFYETVHVLAGNHELYPDLQTDPNQGGFFDEVVHERASYANLGDLNTDLAKFVLDWHREEFPGEEFEPQHQLRVALWRLYNSLFDRLPKVALTGNGAVLCHAGLTDTGPFKCIRAPAAPQPPSFVEAVTWLAHSQLIGLLPSQPGEEFEREQIKLQNHVTWSDYTQEHPGIQPNPSRCGSLFFGPDALQSFLDILGRQVLIRGHQKTLPSGARRLTPHVWTAGKNLITINSVLDDGRFVETDSGLVQTFSRQCLEVPLCSQLTSVDEITVKKL